jgi:hypothetical protein
MIVTVPTQLNLVWWHDPSVHECGARINQAVMLSWLGSMRYLVLERVLWEDVVGRSDQNPGRPTNSVYRGPLTPGSHSHRFKSPRTSDSSPLFPLFQLILASQAFVGLNTVSTLPCGLLRIVKQDCCQWFRDRVPFTTS